ncbi:ATP-binding protein [Burkholderia sp. Ac-20349]|uniref:ATP-binding protein n=1 Tax=Burkholderia sp. Ac-20349 TaxID=2703893 RepID=UPI00197C2B82|nr:ATP-binding protein [Burkholderia sp. Ac-20349]MBN3839238.1 ATP-binding protein [Burkholderia sp. Ac-20349]
MAVSNHNEVRPVGALLGNFGIEYRNSVCDKHGSYIEMSSNFGGVQRWAGCPKCMEERDAEQAAQDAAEIRRNARRTSLMTGWQEAEIPKRFANASFKSYTVESPAQQTALDACAEYAQSWEAILESGRNLIMCGRPGTGKTHLSVAIARVVARKGALPFFARTYEAVQFVRESYRPGSKLSERESIARFVEPDLLILDEVGVQGGGDNEQMILFAILNGRYDACKPTIVISNEPLEGIERYLTPRVVDRLREGGGQVLTFEWQSYRGRA